MLRKISTMSTEHLVNWSTIYFSPQILINNAPIIPTYNHYISGLNTSQIWLVKSTSHDQPNCWDVTAGWIQTAWIYGSPQLPHTYSSPTVSILVTWDGDALGLPAGHFQVSRRGILGGGSSLLGSRDNLKALVVQLEAAPVLGIPATMILLQKHWGDAPWLAVAEVQTAGKWLRNSPSDHLKFFGIAMLDDQRTQLW